MFGIKPTEYGRFWVVYGWYKTKTHKKSDGYFSEGLGLAGKEYVENNTKEFISNFDNKDMCFYFLSTTYLENFIFSRQLGNFSQNQLL